MADIERVRARLAGVQKKSRGQHWAKERPWKVETHVGYEGDLLLVDLHDLGAGLARQAVREVAAVAPELQTGAVAFVVGRARNRPGGGVLGRAIPEQLKQVCAEHDGWRFRPYGPARWMLIFDEERAPAAASARMGLGLWLLLAFLALAALVAVFGSC